MRSATLLLLPFALAAPASALTIDTFTDGAYATSLTSGSDTHTATASSALGGKRATYLGVTANPLNQVETLSAGGGDFIVSQGPLAETDVQLVYGFGNALPHLDLSNLKDFQIDFLTSDVVDHVVVNIISNNFGGTVAGDTPALPASPYTMHFDLGAVSPTVNLADVTEIRVNVFGNANSDYAITGIRTVPEPASFAVLGVGAVGLLRRRRR